MIGGNSSPKSLGSCVATHGLKGCRKLKKAGKGLLDIQSGSEVVQNRRKEFSLDVSFEFFSSIYEDRVISSDSKAWISGSLEESGLV
jgi:hypothetical protein